MAVLMHFSKIKSDKNERSNDILKKHEHCVFFDLCSIVGNFCPLKESQCAILWGYGVHFRVQWAILTR